MTGGGLYLPTIWSTKHFLRNDAYSKTRPPPGRVLYFAGTPQGKSFADNREWHGKKVLLLCDLVGAGMGDRVLLAQLAHALVAAGADLTCAYTCPPASHDHPAQRSMRMIMRHLFPLDARVVNTFQPEEHEYLAWMGGYSWQQKMPSLGAAQHMGEFALRRYGLDLNARVVTADEEPLDTPPPPYALVQVTATMHAGALGAALRVARDEAARSSVHLFAIGHATGDCPSGVIDGYRGLPLELLFPLIKGAQWGAGPDSGPAHIAGYYGTPWMAIRAGGVYAAWWLGHYKSVELRLL